MFFENNFCFWLNKNLPKKKCQYLPLKQSCTFRKILKHCVLALTHHLLSICWCLLSLLFLAEDARPWIAKYSHRNRHIIVFTCYGFYLQKNNHKDRIQYCSRYIHTYSNNNIMYIIVLFVLLYFSFVSKI